MYQKRYFNIFLREKHNSARKFFRHGASNMILNDSSFNFDRHTSTKCRIEKIYSVRVNQ